MKSRPIKPATFLTQTRCSQLKNILFSVQIMMTCYDITYCAYTTNNTSINKCDYSVKLVKIIKYVFPEL